MARIIRFPLKMSNGAEVRTLEELKTNFNMESVLKYFSDGSLQKWLASLYEEDLEIAVSELIADMPDLKERLCAILGVEYQSDDPAIQAVIQRRKEKKQILSKSISDSDVLNNIDLVYCPDDNYSNSGYKEESLVRAFSLEKCQ